MKELFEILSAACGRIVFTDDPCLLATPDKPFIIQSAAGGTIAFVAQ